MFFGKAINRFLVLCFVFLLIGNNYNLMSTLDVEGSSGNRTVRDINGPMEVLNNGNFSQSSTWGFKNAIYNTYTLVKAEYDQLPPNYGHFLNHEPIGDTAFNSEASIYQNFTKPIWTPNYPTAVVCELDWKMAAYHSDIDAGNARIDGELFLQIENRTSTINGEWEIFGGVAGRFQTDADPRIGTWYHEKILVGFSSGPFSICPLGSYKLSVILKLSVPLGSNVDDFVCDLYIDNVSLRINDIHEPLVVPNKSVYGPYNSGSGTPVDVDFFAGGFENTSLNAGKFRLNNSGTPGSWHTIFRNTYTYTQNWSIARSWSNMTEGSNTFEIFCIDDIGNFNDSVQITLVKDTIAPVTNINKLNDSYTVREINIEYSGFDPAPSGGYNNTVELWFRFNKTGDFVKYTPPWNPDGLFNESIIHFNLTAAGTGYGLGLYEFYTCGIDNATNYELPKTPVMTNFTVYRDTTPPTPVIIKPNTRYNKGTVPVIAKSDNDTKFIEFYYWLDIDRDGNPDDEDINSTWVFIDNVTLPSIEKNWSTNWITTDQIKYPEFSENEYMVVLKADASDKSHNRGEGFKNLIEIDNIPPIVTITNPKPNTAVAAEYMTINYSLDYNDGNRTNFWYKYSDDEKINWIKINDKDFRHLAGEFDGSYNWKLPSDNRLLGLFIDIKVEVTDDTENIGEDIVVGIYLGPGFPDFVDFPEKIELDEDFGTYVLKLTEYEHHSDPKYTNDNLKWYVTGNTGKIFHLDGDNDTGPDADTFVYTSLADKFGTEQLVYHLHDPFGLEMKDIQTVIVNPINDPPVLDLPAEPFHVHFDVPETYDLSTYISDVDNKPTELTITPDDTEHITPRGLNLTFNYPPTMNGQTESVDLMVDDGLATVLGKISVKISDNYPPRLFQDLPDGLKIREGETVYDYIYLEDYFKDPDKDDLSYTVTVDDINVIINRNTSVTFSAKSHVNGLVKVIFRAMDPYGAWCEGVMYIMVINIPEPPVVDLIPDLYVHWHNPNADDGYTYDFSYFINDPDNTDDELTAWISILSTETDNSWISADSCNNLRFTFKFPFSSAGSKYILALYTADPDNKQAYRVFNISVIFDEWPVESLDCIPKQVIRADQIKENAFNLLNYFEDIDGGSTFDIIENTESKLNVEIDTDFNVDLYCTDIYWEGDTEFVIRAKDILPNQRVYIIVKVRVINPQPQFIWPLPTVNLTAGDETTVEHLKTIIDFDAELSNLNIGSSAPEQIRIEDDSLIINYYEHGTYVIYGWIDYTDSSRNDTWYFTLNVDPPEIPSDKDDNEDKGLTIESYAIIFVIIVIIILVLLFLIQKKRKKTSGVDENNEIVSQLPVSSIKRNQAQKMTDRILSPQPQSVPAPPMAKPAIPVQPQNASTQLTSTNEQITSKFTKPLLPASNQDEKTV
jgi:hypothetical protein